MEIYFNEKNGQLFLIVANLMTKGKKPFSSLPFNKNKKYFDSKQLSGTQIMLE